VVSYRIDSIDPLALTKVGEASGHQCGATYIDRAFVDWCQEKLVNLQSYENDYGSGGHYIMEHKLRLLLKRFEPHKHRYNGNKNATINIPRDLIFKDQDDDQGVVMAKKYGTSKSAVNSQLKHSTVKK
jgi:hypothetical protein